jgi:chromosome segregation ATPase
LERPLTNLGAVMIHIIKSRKIILLAFVIGFCFTPRSTHAFLFNRSPISDTLTSFGVASVVGFATFGAPALLAPIIAAKLTGVAWCGALAYLLFRSTDINRKIYAIHGDTQQLMQDTTVIKRNTSDIQSGVAYLNTAFDAYKQETKSAFDSVQRQQEQHHKETMVATKKVEQQVQSIEKELSEVHTGVNTLKIHVTQVNKDVVIVYGDVKGLGKKLDEQQQTTHAMHQQTQQEIAGVKAKVETMDSSLSNVSGTVNSLKQTVENNTHTLGELCTRTAKIENLVVNTNAAVDRVFEEIQESKDRTLALELQAKQMLEMQDKSNKKQDQQGSAIASMQSDLSDMKGGLGYLVKAKQEKIHKQVATAAAPLLVVAQLSQKPVDDQTNSGLLEEDDLD